jgi:hypothetical protein
VPVGEYIPTVRPHVCLRFASSWRSQARRVPVVDDGPRRHGERFRRLPDGITSEESEFDDLARPWVDLRQCFQRVMEGDHIQLSVGAAT